MYLDSIKSFSLLLICISFINLDHVKITFFWARDMYLFGTFMMSLVSFVVQLFILHLIKATAG